jgi:hypothetical protein
MKKLFVLIISAMPIVGFGQDKIDAMINNFDNLKTNDGSLFFYTDEDPSVCTFIKGGFGEYEVGHVFSGEPCVLNGVCFSAKLKGRGGMMWKKVGDDRWAVYVCF